jgi:hypothetical protein
MQTVPTSNFATKLCQLVYFTEFGMPFEAVNFQNCFKARPVHTSDFLLRFSPFNRCERAVNYECAERMYSQFLTRTFYDWFTRSHPSKGKNRTRNPSEIARVNGPLKFVLKI